jgi:hypothetical protein
MQSLSLRVLPWVFFGLMLAARCAVAAQASHTSCKVDLSPPSDADEALEARKYADAERLYNEMLKSDPASGKAMAGIVRTELAQAKLTDAQALATRYGTMYPGDSDVLDAAGEVQYRRGDVDEAAQTFNKSNHLDPCNGRTHYDVARAFNLSAMYRTAQRELDTAHALAPHNPIIQRAWEESHATPGSRDEQIAALQARLTDKNAAAMSDYERDAIKARIHELETGETGTCEMVEPVAEAKLPIVSIISGAGVGLAEQDMVAAGLDVYLNGKRKRLEIDTGASGLFLSRSVAKAAGLIPEAVTHGGGIGDEGPVKTFMTHVDDIRIGGMEFKNCMVEVLDHGGVLDTDGLIGPDVFRDYLVTLDIPSREIRLGPLPPRPGDPPRTTVLHTTEDELSPISPADRARDRYIAPEMKDWTPVFRAGHLLIFQTLIGKAPLKLFAMDTGAGMTSITPEAARQVTSVSGDPFMVVRGISGQTHSVFYADNITINFGGVKQTVRDMTSYDAGAFSNVSGTEVSGLIGFPLLRELVISIDYRDNLVHVTYDPKKGYHAH